MALIEWTKTLETGLWPVDAQHRQLVDLMNSLDEAVRNSSGDDVMKKTLSELVAYSGEHFRVEERLMEIAAYPGLGRHKLFHEYFVKRMSGFDERHSAGDGTVAEELLDFLKLWFVDHVSQTDHDYIPYVSKIQS